MDDIFHDTIYGLSGSNVLMDTLTPLHRKALRYRKISLEKNIRMDKSVKEHMDILKAIVEGNAQEAQKLMGLHIQNAKNSMLGEEK